MPARATSTGYWLRTLLETRRSGAPRRWGRDGVELTGAALCRKDRFIFFPSLREESREGSRRSKTSPSLGGHLSALFQSHDCIHTRCLLYLLRNREQNNKLRSLVQDMTETFKVVTTESATQMPERVGSSSQDPSLVGILNSRTYPAQQPWM